MDVAALPVNAPHNAKPAADDITAGLLDYDWRRETGSTAPQPTPVAQPVAPAVRQVAAPVDDITVGLLDYDWRSETDSTAPPTPVAQPVAPAVRQVAAPVDDITVVPVAPANLDHLFDLHNMAMSAPMSDPAANMLQTLESKLAGIKSSIRAMPRTGYQHRPRLSCEQPMVLEQPVQTHIDDLDLDFVALIGAKNTPPEPTESQKRKAVELNAKALDLKERNRQSAKASRERKKARVEMLHKQVEDLTTQNLDLAQTCKEVAEDNAKLRQELVEFGHEFDEEGRPVFSDAVQSHHWQWWATVGFTH